MNTEELSNRLTQIVQGITNTHPIRIKATIEVFLEEFDPSQNYLLSISDIEGYETQFIEFEIWDRKGWSYTRYQTFQGSQYIP